jgi:hypothetical protein
MSPEKIEKALDLLYQYGQTVGVDKFRYDPEHEYRKANGRRKV